jgi:hypothetical protein
LIATIQALRNWLNLFHPEAVYEQIPIEELVPKED